jgi:hypothetical protein
LLDETLVLIVREGDGSPASKVIVKRIPSGHALVRADTGRGLYVIDSVVPFAGPFGISSEVGSTELPTLPLSGVVEVALEPR